jgi:hypothetical protein
MVNIMEPAVAPIGSSTGGVPSSNKLIVTGNNGETMVILFVCSTGHRNRQECPVMLEDPDVLLVQYTRETALDLSHDTFYFDMCVKLWGRHAEVILYTACVAVYSITAYLTDSA